MFITIDCNFLNLNQLESDLLFPLSSTELLGVSACMYNYLLPPIY